MKYCLHCGSKVKSTGPGAYVCQGCQAKLYDNPKPGVNCFILTDDNKIVLGARDIEPYKGKLDGLGGFVDQDETLEEAAKREMAEEGGITDKDIVSMDYLTSATDVYPWQPEAHHLTSAYFIVRLKPGVEVKAADDVTNIKTYDVAELDPESFAWDGMRQAFTEFKKVFADL